MSDCVYAAAHNHTGENTIYQKLYKSCNQDIKHPFTIKTSVACTHVLLSDVIDTCHI